MSDSSDHPDHDAQPDPSSQLYAATRSIVEGVLAQTDLIEADEGFNPHEVAVTAIMDGIADHQLCRCDEHFEETKAALVEGMSEACDHIVSERRGQDPDAESHEVLFPVAKA